MVDGSVAAAVFKYFSEIPITTRRTLSNTCGASVNTSIVSEGLLSSLKAKCVDVCMGANNVVYEAREKVLSCPLGLQYGVQWLQRWCSVWLG